MGLRSESSGLYWQETEADGLEEALLELDDDAPQEQTAGQQYMYTGATGAGRDNEAVRAARKYSPMVSNGQQSAGALIETDVNKQGDEPHRASSKADAQSGPPMRSLHSYQSPHRPSDHGNETANDEDDEVTFNPDAELEDAQAAQHGYEDAQFYEKINFGEFSKYMANKRRKLGVQQGASKLNAKTEETSTLLAGLRIHINGETEPPAHVLSRLVVLHGGVYVPYLDAKKTSATHIIASNLTPSKRIAFKAYIVVQAAWMMDSIREGKVQNWRLYREDQKAIDPNDVGIAPAGTQIAQPKLAFTAKAAPSPKRKTAVPVASTSAAVSPRRLPPPTSDPITLLHAQGAEAAATDGGDTRPAAGGPPVGWYNTKPNARSAALLQDEAWRLQETAVNATEFLEKYYKESRLHWLSTWKAELKKMMGELSEGREVDLTKARRKGPLKGTEEDGRIVLHVDFDSFFVSASLLARPHLKGLPVVVCHASVGDTSSSSEIASASYEAREFGIRNGMSLGSARSKCPDLQTVPYDFELYRATSTKFYSILFAKSQELEAVSIDEAYISIADTDPPRNSGQLLEFAEGLRSEIRQATGLETSIGVSHNKLLARLATNRAKTASSFQIGNSTGTSRADIESFLSDTDIETLPGIGWKRANDVNDKLSELSKRLDGGHFTKKNGKGKESEKTTEAPAYDTVGQLLRFTKTQLKQAMGDKTGEMLYNYARGIDSRDLETESVRKSVSAEVNYGIRFKDQQEVNVFLGDKGLAAEVARRLDALGVKGRQITLKVMRRAVDAPIEPPKFLGHGVCDTFNVSKALDLTSDAYILGVAACELMQSLACPPEELRGIGLQMQKLESVTSDGKSLLHPAGQSRLQFEPSVKASKAPPVAELHTEKGRVAAISVPILISDKTSSPHFDKDGEMAEGRRTRRKEPVNYVDLSSEDSATEDLRLLSQMPSNFVQKARDNDRQSVLQGDIQKKSRSASVQAKPTAILIPATSPAAANAQAPVPSPNRLSAKQLSLLGLDPTFFKSCAPPLQNELLRECLLKRGEKEEVRRLLDEAGAKGKKNKKSKPLWAPVFEQAAADAAKREEQLKRAAEKAKRKSRGPVFLHLEVGKSFKSPQFAGKSSLEDLRVVLRQWMEGVGLDAGPALEEVEEFAKFCMDTISRSPKRNGGHGPDIAKIDALLCWWKFLIDTRSRAVAEAGSQRLAADSWRDTYHAVLGRVNSVVQISVGAELRMR